MPKTGSREHSGSSGCEHLHDLLDRSSITFTRILIFDSGERLGHHFRVDQDGQQIDAASLEEVVIGSESLKDLNTIADGVVNRLVALDQRSTKLESVSV